jgi:uracil-DNA glycosylase
MPRSDRHRAMLEAMGLPVFEAPVLVAADTAALGEEPVAVPTSGHAPQPLRERVPPPTVPITLAPAGPLGGMAWAELQATVAACRACTLCEARTQTVFGGGQAPASWMIVGEAPGEQEDLSGQPFVGKSGALLDAMLVALHLTREASNEPGDANSQVYIANAIKCRPPRNRNPSQAEVTACEPYLKRQIELVNPKVILAMGRYAVLSLLGTDEAIGRLRGRVHHHQGRAVVVTYHPAYLLRNPIDKARAWEDLCLAASLAP